jgi:hypothetical protein
MLLAPLTLVPFWNPPNSAASNSSSTISTISQSRHPTGLLNRRGLPSDGRPTMTRPDAPMIADYAPNLWTSAG